MKYNKIHQGGTHLAVMRAAPHAPPQGKLAVVPIDVLREPQLRSHEALLVLVLVGEASGSPNTRGGTYNSKAKILSIK